MPELPEVENARQVVEKALNRVIVDIDDIDTFECRPHRPGEIASALMAALTEACRRGKAMWFETAIANGSTGPTLGIHLGMGSRIIVTAPDGDQTSRYGGGDPHVGERDTDKPEWTRFAMTFEDGGQLRLFDNAASAGFASSRTSTRSGLMPLRSRGRIFVSESVPAEHLSKHGCSIRPRSAASAISSPMKSCGRARSHRRGVPQP